MRLRIEWAGDDALVYTSGSALRDDVKSPGYFVFTPARLRDIEFSVIYFVTPHAVIVRKSSGITSVRQLAGRKASSASTSTAAANRPNRPTNR